MEKLSGKKLRRWNIALHRDLGYFFTGLILIYCVSGIALNHADDWNPNFIIEKDSIRISQPYARAEITDEVITGFCNQVGEDSYKLYDFPTADQVKIYFEDASLHVHFTSQEGIYERISKRPLFYQTNVIHLNSLKGWRWFSDIFGIMLIAITMTGLFVLKGKKGIAGRGKWFIAAGFVPPLLAMVLQALI